MATSCEIGFTITPARLQFNCGPRTSKLPAAPTLEPLRNIFSGHRPRNTVALANVTAELHQLFTLLRCFHAFGHQIKVERFSQANNAFYDGKVAYVGQHIAHKTLVYF